MVKQNFEQHISITSAEHISSICCKFFDNIDISYFSFFREFNNGSRIWLCNNASWTEHLYKNIYGDITSFKLPLETTKQYTTNIQGLYYWDTLCCYLENREERNLYKKRITIAKEEYDICDGISLINCHENYVDYFNFASNRNFPIIKDFYTNNLELLINFSHYFLYESSSIIKKSLENKIIDSHIKEGTKICNGNKTNVNRISNKYYLNKNTYITAREFQSLSLVARGKSYKETARILKISDRTVEKHIFSIIEKLNTINKSNLIEYFWNSDISKIYL